MSLDDKRAQEIAAARRNAARNNTFGAPLSNYRRKEEPESPDGSSAARRRMSDAMATNDIRIAAEADEKRKSREAEKASRAEAKAAEKNELFARLHGFRSYESYLADKEQRRSEWEERNYGNKR